MKICASGRTTRDGRMAGGTPSKVAQRRGPLLETAGLLLAPVLAVFVLGGHRMMSVSMIDPHFYTAYLQNGPDLLTRYGDADYYWVRQGFLLPARLTYLAFGALPGFLALRYLFALLAIVPTYLLLRRLYGRLAGATGVAVILVSPVVLTSWGTDYPDSSALAYLFAGIACLFMPVEEQPGRRLSRQGRRVGWVVASGVALSLAVHSQTWAAPLVAATVLAYVVTHGVFASERPAPPSEHTHRRVRPSRSWLEPLAHAVLLGALFVFVTAGLAAAANVVFGSSNIIEPTVSAAEHFRTPAELGKWHSSGWTWILDDPYLLVLPALVAGWAVAWFMQRRGAQPARTVWSEWGVVLTTLLQGAAYLVTQFLGKVAVVEFFLYSSMLWAAGCLTTAFLLARIARALDGQPLAVRLAPLALVVGTPWAFVPFTPEFQLDYFPVGAALVVAIVAAGAVAAWRAHPAVALPAIALVLVAAQALVVGVPYGRPLRPGQVLLPTPPYGQVIGTDEQVVVDRYVAISRLPDLVPPPDGEGNDDLLTWWPGGSDTLTRAAAQWMWHRNSLRETMPELSEDSLARLLEREPELVVLLSETGSEFADAAAALESAGFATEVLRTGEVTEGATTIHLQVLGVGGYPS